MNADERDARRYRWLRDALMDLNGADVMALAEGDGPETAGDFDAAVDAAMEPRYELTDAGREALGSGK